MPITVPILPHMESPRDVDLSKIPENEHNALAHVQLLLNFLSIFERRLLASITLFGLCDEEHASLDSVARADRAFGSMPHHQLIAALSDWREMAARDGAISIYHFGQTTEAINDNLPTCPSLNKHVNRDALKIAFKLFRARFPRYEMIRHVVGHAAEWAGTSGLRKRHSHKGQWKGGPAGEELTLANETGELQFLGSLVGNKFYVSHDGKVYDYEVSPTTLEKMRSIRRAIYAAVVTDTIARPSA